MTTTTTFEDDIAPGHDVELANALQEDSMNNAIDHTDKNDPTNNSIKPDKIKKTKPFIVLVAFCAALGGLIFGYDIAGAGATFVPGKHLTCYKLFCKFENILIRKNLAFLAK